MPVFGVVPDVRSRIHMQHNAPFFQVSCFSKKVGGAPPFRPFPSLLHPSGQVDVRLFWIRPAEGEPSSDLDASPTGRGGDSSMRHGTRTSRTWDDAYSGGYHQVVMIGSHQGFGVFACHLLLASLQYLRIFGHSYNRLWDTGKSVFRAQRQS